MSPDRRGLYAIGGGLVWQAWTGDVAHTAGQATFALGVREAFTAATVQPEGLREVYERGRAAAHQLTSLPLVGAVPPGCGEV